jgi:hypothetical protein
MKSAQNPSGRSYKAAYQDEFDQDAAPDTNQGGSKFTWPNLGQMFFTIIKLPVELWFKKHMFLGPAIALLLANNIDSHHQWLLNNNIHMLWMTTKVIEQGGVAYTVTVRALPLWTMWGVATITTITLGVMQGLTFLAGYNPKVFAKRMETIAMERIVAPQGGLAGVPFAYRFYSFLYHNAELVSAVLFAIVTLGAWWADYVIVASTIPDRFGSSKVTITIISVVGAEFLLLLYKLFDDARAASARTMRF